MPSWLTTATSSPVTTSAARARIFSLTQSLPITPLPVQPTTSASGQRSRAAASSFAKS